MSCGRWCLPESRVSATKLKQSVLGLILLLQTVFAGGAKYLIVTADEFYAAVQPLAEWRHKRGMQTAVVRLSEIVPQTREGIREYIVNAYRTWNPQPQYVLLVGDTEKIPVGQDQPCKSDNYYGEMDGHFRAELAVGRFPCRTVKECEVMVAKTLLYERHPLFPDTAWYCRGLVAVRFDHAGDTLGFYVRDMRYFVSTLRDSGGFVVESLFWREGEGWHGQGPDSARHIAEALRRGAGFVLFRGYGAWDGTFYNWNMPMNVQPNQLANGFYLPVVYGGCCQTVFAPEDRGVGEEWLRVGSALVPRGAVAYLGNSIHSLAAAWRSKVLHGFYKALFVYDTLTLGRALLFGKDSLYRWMRANGHPDTTRDSVVRYVEQCIIGDPALQPWTTFPRKIVVEHPDIVPAGPWRLSVSVRSGDGQPLKGACVCAVKEGEFYVTAYTDTSGKAELDIDAHTAGVFSVTVTGKNLRPYEGVCFVAGGDAGVTTIVSPKGTYFAGAVVTPACSVRNFGTRVLRFYRVRMRIGAYDRSVTVSDSHPAHTSRYVVFPACTTIAGVFSVVCSTELAADERNSNDCTTCTLNVRPNWPRGWSEVAPVPTESMSKPQVVKEGGWLACHRASNTFFCTRGNKSADFYEYNPVADQWKPRQPIPVQEDGKIRLPGKGGGGVSDGRRYLYVVKGNNTLSFWRYDVEQDSWQRLRDIPCDARRKNVKGGGDLVYVRRGDSGQVYLLKGYTNEFYRYDVRTEKWDTLENAPDASGKGKYQKGSFLVYDGRSSIYLHQSRYNDGEYHYLYRYDLDIGRWQAERLRGMPVIDYEKGKNKARKSGDGASGAWDTDDPNHFYALKGGGSDGFYRYSVAGNSWVQLEALPAYGSTKKKKGVKGGGDLVAWGAGTYFALKGNGTRELWRFVAPPDVQLAGGQTVGGTGRFPVVLAVRNNGSVRLPLYKAGSWPLDSRVRIFDPVGRCLLAIPALRVSSCLNSPVLLLDMRQLSPGAYIVRLDGTGFAVTYKLILQ